MPKSITIQGPPYNSYAATTSTRRSEPSSLGSVLLTLIPVFVPGPTIIGFIPKYLIIPLFKEYITLGTTDEIITSSISLILIFFLAINSAIVEPYSSDVFTIWVFILNVANTLSSLNSPSVILVFPTSTVSNIIFLLPIQKLYSTFLKIPVNLFFPFASVLSLVHSQYHHITNPLHQLLL